MTTATPRAVKDTGHEFVAVVIERDDDGMWSASIAIGPGVSSFGEGDIQEAAIQDDATGSRPCCRKRPGARTHASRS
jgi:hypothetical protein